MAPPEALCTCNGFEYVARHLQAGKPGRDLGELEEDVHGPQLLLLMARIGWQLPSLLARKALRLFNVFVPI